MISGQTAEETAKVGAFARRTTFPMPLGFIGAMQAFETRTDRRGGLSSFLPRSPSRSRGAQLHGARLGALSGTTPQPVDRVPLTPDVPFTEL